MPDSPIVLEKHLEADDKRPLIVDALKSATPLSKQKIKAAMQKGCVWLTRNNRTQRVRRAKSRFTKGQSLHIYYDSRIIESTPVEPTLIADEQNYSIWNKPSGLLSQGSKWGDHCTITRWAEQNLSPQRNAFTVHRLDKSASGIILIAHSKQAAAKLSELFAQRDIVKHYIARVEGKWDLTERKTIDSPIDNKNAISHVHLISYRATDQSTLLKIEIETGRKHQIRRHLAQSGFPIIGDRLYGNRHDVDLMLSSVKLAFTCPFSGRLQSYELDPQFD
ncbi:RluA family pseudouridine synthase [Pleionea sediminis]|uniref:RluA family pseudouridine synthase n=1 Tax=Pleionea sediminis TaxID=2569479 RepID=UPI00197C2035|nr:RluA family pseudouridine synthase [Pleionea sediminis]